MASSHTASCVPSTHCGMPMRHAPHPLMSGRPCSGEACPVSAAGLAESAERIRANRQAATDLGAGDTKALDRIAAAMRSPASVPVKMATVRSILRAAGR